MPRAATLLILCAAFTLIAVTGILLAAIAGLKEELTGTFRAAIAGLDVRLNATTVAIAGLEARTIAAIAGLEARTSAAIAGLGVRIDELATTSRGIHESLTTLPWQPWKRPHCTSCDDL